MIIIKPVWQLELRDFRSRAGYKAEMSFVSYGSSCNCVAIVMAHGYVRWTFNNVSFFRILRRPIVLLSDYGLFVHLNTA